MAVKTPEILKSITTVPQRVIDPSSEKKARMARAIHNVGLTPRSMATTIKKNIRAGTAVKATADTSLRGIELAARLGGYIEPKQDLTSYTQNNVYYNELKSMTDEQLNEKIKTLQDEILSLRTE